MHQSVVLMRAAKVFCQALLLSTLCACSGEGYYEPGERIDEPARCQARSTAWLRHTLDPSRGDTEEEQLLTEVLILGHEVTSQDDTNPGCLYLASYDYEGSVVLEQGEFVLFTSETAAEGLAHRGEWTGSFIYEFIREPEAPLLVRMGATRRELVPIASRMVEFERAGDGLILTVEGERKEFHELAPLAAMLDWEDSSERRYLLRMLNLGLLTSQVRWLGFGSSDMTAYRSPKTFSGLLSGTVDVNVSVSIDFNASAALNYQKYSDIPGLTLSGPQRVQISAAGDGFMAGSQHIRFALDPNSEPFFDAEVDYSDILVEHGFGSAGSITVSTASGDYTENAGDVLVVDFRGLLPFDETPQ